MPKGASPSHIEDWLGGALRQGSPHLKLSIIKAEKRLLVSAQERGQGGEEGAVTPFESLEVDWDEVSDLSQEIAHLLTAQQQARGLLARLERAGQMLFELIFGPRAKDMLRRSQAQTLSLSLHGDLLSLPWELVHDGSNFLSLRYAMGRLVQAEDGPPDAPAPLPQGSLSLLIIADPRGDLPHADEEGQRILDIALDEGEEVEPNLLAAPTTRRRVLESFRSYNALHLAGHGKDGSWLLKDGTLDPGDILRMRGSGRFPSLVFANACVSGAIERWDPGAQEMARGFLLGGSRHFIGAICEIPDVSSLSMAETVYQGIFGGLPIGEALLRGRQALAEGRDVPPLAWAGYVLYGDPLTLYGPRYTLKDPAPPPQESDPNGPPSQLIIPQVDATPEAPTLADVPPPKAPKRRWHRVLLGAGLGILLSVVASLETLKLPPFLDALWMATIQRVGPQDPIQSPLVLLGVTTEDANPRGLYAELLEGLYAYPGPGPRVVAFDTWFRPLGPGEEPGPDELRLTRAIALALSRFPVVFGQRWDPEARRPLPPPPWLLEGVRGALREAQGTQSGSTSPRFMERLAFGHVALGRVAEGIIWDLDQRIPFGCEGDGIPFSWRVAFPNSLQRPVCKGGGAAIGVTGEGGTIPLDGQGRMLIRYAQLAEWGPGEANFPGFGLRGVVAGWRGDLEGGSPGPQAFEDRILLVGLAKADSSSSDGDRRQTPIGEMYGVELQANAIDQLLQRDVPRPLSPPLLVLLGAIIGGLGGLFFRTGVMLIAVAALLVLGSYGLWVGLRLVVFPGAGLLTLLALALYGRRGPKAGEES